MEKTCLYEMKRESIDGLVVERIGPAEEVFPALVLEAVGDIGFAIVSRAQLGIGSPPHAQSLAFQVVKGIKVTYRTDVELTCGLVPGRDQVRKIHQPHIGAHI